MDWSKFLSRKFLVLVIWMLSGVVLLLAGKNIDEVLKYYDATSTGVLGYVLAEGAADAAGAFRRPMAAEKTGGANEPVHQG